MCLKSLDAKSGENTSVKSDYLSETFVGAFLAIKADIWGLREGWTFSGVELRDVI